MAEAAPAAGTCGKYQRISKENTRLRWILTWDLLRKKSKIYGIKQLIYSQSHADRKLWNPGFFLHISVLLK